MTIWRRGTLDEWSVNGSVYPDDQFQEGYATINGMNKQGLMLRYDAYHDEIEYLDDNGKVKLLPNGANVETLIGSLLYRKLAYLDYGNLKCGFFVPLNEGKTQLYLRNTKSILYQTPENGYETFEPPRFVLNTQYYLKRKDKPAMPLNDLSRKEVFAVLWEHFTDLRSYARENKLRMRTEGEVIQVLAYYDTLIENQ